MSMKQKKEKEIVFVGLSGGVDSSVSAKRLIDQGYTVVGVFIKTWQPDFLVCNWESERLDAMRVCAHLGIPFLMCDAVSAYRDEVAQYMINEYKNGRTPNPDVMCNQYVKFGVFLDFARTRGVHKIATGHYAQVQKINDIYHLYRGADIQKDQSYFLWTLTQAQLSRIYFPIGDTVKSVVRAEAQKSGLLTSKKSDSQGICFLGEIDIQEFLSHYVRVEKGDVINEQGEIIGKHDGALFYTMGQRHGFYVENSNTESTPYFVVAKNMDENTITVSQIKSELVGQSILLTQVHFTQGVCPTVCEAQFRYRQKPFRVQCTDMYDSRVMLKIVDAHIETPSLGQSCVFYNGDECLGGGIINQIV